MAWRIGCAKTFLAVSGGLLLGAGIATSSKCRYRFDTWLAVGLVARFHLGYSRYDDVDRRLSGGA